MKKLVPIPPESLKGLEKDDLKNFDYQFVSIKLRDGRVFPQAVASEGFVIQVKGCREIPFVETDIESVDVDGEPWNFRRGAVRARTPRRKPPPDQTQTPDLFAKSEKYRLGLRRFRVLPGTTPRQSGTWRFTL